MVSIKKRLSQNFLKDSESLEIFSSIGIGQEEEVLEIGPGRGALTKLLVKSAKKVHAVEIDKDLISVLNKNFGKEPSFLLYNKDILKVKLADFSSKKLRLVGNLPYSLSTDIMLWTFSQMEHVKDIHYMLQKEFAERLFSKPHSKKYGRISILSQYLVKIHPVKVVKPDSFFPMPSVDSLFIRLVPIEGRTIKSEVSKILQSVTRAAFSKRRKMIGTSLKNLLNENDFESLNLNTNLRPENLEVDEFIKISKYLIKKRNV